jgi:hypothetical protein
MVLKRRVKFHETPHIVGQRHGVPQGILHVFILIFYENVFQNPEFFPTQVSLSPEQSTLECWVIKVIGLQKI